MKHLDIKRALAEHGMTQAELCKKTGILSQNMRTITNGNPTIEKLFTVAKGIGCDITVLFYSSEETMIHYKTNDAENKQQHAISSDSGIFNLTSANATNVQDAREMMYCPHCGTKFFVVNVPNVGE